MTLNKTQQKEFTDRGFTVIKSFFNSEQMKIVSSWLDDLHDKTPMRGAEAKYYEKSTITDENILVRVEHIFGYHNPAITKLLLPEKLIDCLTILFGEPPVLFKEKVNYKLPGCRADKLHQDQAAGWNAYGSFYISVCIVVDKNTKENAALSFLKSGNYKKELMTEEWKPLTEDDPPYLPEDDYMIVEADSGDIIIFDSYVPHGSPANTSNKSRRNIFLTFNKESDGDKRKTYYLDKWGTYPPNEADEARTTESFRV